MSVAILEVGKLERKKAGRPKSDNPRGIGQPVRIDPRIVAKAKIVATRRATDVSSYLNSILDGPVGKDYMKAVKEMSADLEGGAK